MEDLAAIVKRSKVRAAAIDAADALFSLTVTAMREPASDSIHHRSARLYHFVASRYNIYEATWQHML